MAYRTSRTETAGGGKTRITTKTEYYETMQEREQRRKAKLMEKAVKTATQPVIAGIKVSQETYNDYANRTYETSFGQLKYKTLELYATGAGVAQESPEISEECMAILEQIKAEVSGINKQETKAAANKHKEFTGYLEDLRALYKNVTDERQRMNAEHEKAVSRLDQAAEIAAKDGENGASVLRAKAERAEENERYQAETEAFHERVNLEIDAIRTALKARINEFYGIDGGKIDDNVTKLLNSGIKLTESEIDGLFDRFTDNTTMLRLLSDYCAAHNINKKDVAVLGGRALSNGSHELEVFENIANFLTLAAGYGSEVSEKVWSPENGHFERMLNRSIQELTDVIVKP